jgi:hypothetical protein
MQFWSPRILKAIAVLVIALAWFAGTNHCSLGAAFTGKAGNDGNGASAPTCHCAEHCKTSNAHSQGPSAMLVCCQGLLSPSVELTQAKLKVSLIFLGFQPWALDWLTRFEALEIQNLSADYHTGPPKENCFVSTVLKRSLPSHAPPFSV